MNRTLTVKQYRELLEITQKEIASKLKISQPAYSQIENGYAETSIQNYQKIAEVLGIEVGYIIDDEIPVFFYVYSRIKPSDDLFKRKVEEILEDISQKIQKLKKVNRLV